MTDGTNPKNLEIKGKVTSYSFEINNSDNITIENLSFFPQPLKFNLLKILFCKIVNLPFHLHQKECLEILEHQKQPQ